MGENREILIKRFQASLFRTFEDTENKIFTSPGPTFRAEEEEKRSTLQLINV